GDKANLHGMLLLGEIRLGRKGKGADARCRTRSEQSVTTEHHRSPRASGAARAVYCLLSVARAMFMAFGHWTLVLALASPRQAARAKSEKYERARLGYGRD